MAAENLLGVLLAGLLSLAGVIYVQRTAKQMAAHSDARTDAQKERAADAERDRIEADAYRRARDSYEAGIADMVAQAKRRDEQHAEELRYLNDRLSERNKRIAELEDQLRETRRQVREIRESAELMGSRLDVAERAIAKNTRNATAASERADVSEARADAAETQADTDRGE